MEIRKVQIDALRYDPTGARHRAIVILTTDRSTLCLQCDAGLPRDAPRRDLAATLVSDALRQVRRLPEFRNGAQDVTISDTAPPEFRASA